MFVIIFGLRSPDFPSTESNTGVVGREEALNVGSNGAGSAKGEALEALIVKE